MAGPVDPNGVKAIALRARNVPAVRGLKRNLTGADAETLQHQMIGLWRGLIAHDRIDRETGINQRADFGRGHGRVEKGRRAIGEDGCCKALRLQSFERRGDIGISIKGAIGLK